LLPPRDERQISTSRNRSRPRPEGLERAQGLKLLRGATTEEIRRDALPTVGKPVPACFWTRNKQPRLLCLTAARSHSVCGQNATRLKQAMPAGHEEHFLRRRVLRNRKSQPPKIAGPDCALQEGPTRARSDSDPMVTKSWLFSIVLVILPEAIENVHRPTFIVEVQRMKWNAQLSSVDCQGASIRFELVTGCR
jgi:hypothetical protein